MDVMLERILSLIPKKPDGKFVHGSKKDFADSLELPSNIVAEWVSGRNKSYPNYLYEIAAKYDVSVEWLQGKTDEKSPPPLSIDLGDGEIKTAPTDGSGMSHKHQELLKLFDACSNEEQNAFLEMVRLMSEKKGE